MEEIPYELPEEMRMKMVERSNALSRATELARVLAERDFEDRKALAEFLLSQANILREEIEKRREE